MRFDKLNSTVSRVFFFGALLLLGLVALEKIVNLFGYTILRGYSGGRVLEFSGILLSFVIAMLLRQIREELHEKRG